jgi:hypothetical protein
MQDAGDHDLSFVTQIIDSVITRKIHAQTRREILAPGRGERKISQRFAILFDAVDQARRGLFGSFASDIEPDFG